jgi:hypothetical protein
VAKVVPFPKIMAKLINNSAFHRIKVKNVVKINTEAE